MSESPEKKLVLKLEDGSILGPYKVERVDHTQDETSRTATVTVASAGQIKLTDENLELAWIIKDASGTYPHEPVDQMEALRIAEALIAAGYGKK